MTQDIFLLLVLLATALILFALEKLPVDLVTLLLLSALVLLGIRDRRQRTTYGSSWPSIQTLCG